MGMNPGTCMRMRMVIHTVITMVIPTAIPTVMDIMTMHLR